MFLIAHVILKLIVQDWPHRTSPTEAGSQRDAADSRGSVYHEAASKTELFLSKTKMVLKQVLFVVVFLSLV